MDIDYFNFLKLGKEQVDSYILNLYETVNTSENYDGYQWSLPEVFKNLEDGYFDIELDNNNELSMFGIVIDVISDEDKNTLLGLNNT